MVRTLFTFITMCVVGTTLPLSAEETNLNRVVLKQGCALKYPASLQILDREHVANVEKAVVRAAAESSPQFQEKVSGATLAFAPVDKRSCFKCLVPRLNLTGTHVNWGAC